MIRGGVASALEVPREEARSLRGPPGRSASAEDSTRIRASQFAAAALAFACGLTLYFTCAAPGVLFGDSGELQVTALLGGIPHSPGYPTFVMIGRLFTRLGWENPAFRITFMSGCFGALALALFVPIVAELAVRPLVALVGALAYGCSFTVWRSSERTEVYSLSICLALLALWRTLVALRTRRLREALLAGLLLGVTLTGHLYFMPAVTLLGLTLAGLVVRTQRRPILPLCALLAAFLIGLSPYLYLVWADVHHATMNYYQLVMQVQNPQGLPRADFDTPWKRLLWDLLGRDKYPTHPPAFDPRGLVRGVIQTGVILYLFELGPFALPLGLLGLARLWRERRGTALLLAAWLALSIPFAAALAAGVMLEIFLVPAVLMAALLSTVGLGDLLERLGAGRGPGAWRAAAAAVLALALLVLPGHPARVWADHHPLGRWRMRVEDEEAAFHPPGLFPSLRGYWEPTRFGEAAMAVLPRDALVLSDWPEFNVLRYMRYVLGARPDLTLMPTTPETLVPRLERWQREHDVTRRPIVFFTRVPRLESCYAAMDSLAVGDRRRAYVQRHPLLYPPER